ncbi:MAG: valine--tRNA ligase [Candidatus Excrementavichristensenella sp.]|jgi:valyl-tRNA synthetase
MREMDKVFRPQEVEDRLYAEWMDKGYFIAERVPGKKPFVIMMPPPNITGQLHMGHAMDTMPQDVLTRYHRMKGDPTLWLPGTDHASIATEVKIIDALKSEGLTKQDLGREGFLERAWAWREKYGRLIVEQQKKLGASCDWSRERFTMDEGLNKAVIEVFVRLYEKGLIYRGNRIINWCPTCKTALSDAEVEYEEQDTSLWYIRYPGADGDVVVATTRPETMLGDTGVAVNPEDPRYTGLVGKTVTLPIMDREIPIVGDAYVDPAFGTGAVKMTPAHDPNDFEVGRRHGLPVLRVLTDDGYMNENAGRFQGMTRSECRKKVVEELEELGLLVKIEPLQHNVGTCYRCHDTVEPMVSTQWFVEMAPLAKPAAEAARTGALTFIPERFTKTYLNWMDNIRDWCISRQLWWGHRIPAYYCDDCGEMVVARKAPGACPTCGGALRQDEDVLDTWFSSALWPFSTLGWPDQTEDLAYFYPTTVMISGYDILFFWDARMIFSGIEQMGRLPFDTVLLHGLVRDAQGRKMSKSLGNGIDPLEMIEKYGCDALRFSLAMGVAPGNDVRFSEEKIEGFRNFANKIWNASRFVLMNLDGMPADIRAIDPSALDAGDRWILTRFGEAVEGVTGNLEGYELGLAATKIYEFAWSSFCDWYIELSKQKLNGEDEAAREATRAVLYYVLLGILKLLHPFMPFLTDEVYRHLPRAQGDPGSIMIAPWPEQPERMYPEDAARMEGVMEVIRAIRNLRAEMNVQAGKRASLILRPREGWKDVLAASEQYFKRLAYTTQLELIGPESPNPDKAASAVTVPCELFIPLGELVDIDRELARLGKDKKTMEAEIARGEGKLKNEGFLKKAPQALVQAEQEKLATNRQVLLALEDRIRELSALA